jgi:hypothetical protein
MIEVELPDGRVVEFPAGTSQDQIRAVITRLNQPQAPRPPSQPLPPMNVDPAEGMSMGERALVGAGSALRKGYLGLRNLLPGQELSPKEQEELEIFRKNRGNLGAAGMVGEVAGNIAMTALPMAGMARAGQLAGRILPNAVARYGTAGAAGAVTGAGFDPEDRAGGAITGAIGGVGGQAAGDLIGRGIRGLIPKSAAAARMPQSVQDASTLGQLADKNTFAGRFYSGMEEVGRSVPLAGSRISRAREGGIDAWRNAIIDDVSAPGFRAPPGEGADRLASVYKDYKRQYGAALANQSIMPSQFFEQQVLKMTTDPRRGLSSEQAEAIRNTVMKAYQARFQGVPTAGPPGTATTVANPGRAIQMRGQEAKDFESFLSDFARRYRKGTGPMDDKIGDLYGDLERAWTAAYRRQMGPGVRKQLRPLDENYAKLVTVENAAGATGSLSGNFSPQQLNTAAKTRTGQRRYGRGEGLLNKEAQYAKEVFMDRIGNSGTTDRALGALGLAGGLAVDPTTTAISLGVLGAGTTKVGKAAMLGETATQKLLKRMRADRAAEILGPTIGASFADTVTE